MIEIANFGKHLFEGPGTKAFLNKLLAGRLPKPGRVALSPMLSPKGRLAGDLTVSCLAPDRFLLLGSGTAQEVHRRWFESNLPREVIYRNVSDALHGVAISGPRSRELLARATRQDVSHNSLRFRDARETFVCGVPVKLLRLSFSGELGYEIYTAPQYLLRLWEGLKEAGADLGVKPYGNRTLMSLRLEKGWGVWGLEFRPDYTAAMSGLDAFIDWDKEFIGKPAALAERDNGPKDRLVTLVVESLDDVVGDEAILHDGVCVGHVTSGGFAHHIGVSVAMGYISTKLASDRTGLFVEIGGELKPARVVDEPLYDPEGYRMRA